MEDGKKTAIALGVAGGIWALIYLATRAKAAPPPPPPEGAAIIIEILGPDGEPIPGSSPVDLTEGETYTVRLTITNLSTKADVPWEATLNVGIIAETNLTSLIPAQSSNEYFTANQSRTFNYPMSVPLGSGGESGEVFVSVKDPAGVELTSAGELIAIAEVPIIYGAGIVIGG